MDYIKILLFTLGLGVIIATIGPLAASSGPQDKIFTAITKVDVAGAQYVEVNINDTIGETSFGDVIKHLEGLPNRDLPIVIFINTHGGSASALFDFFNTVRNWDGPIITVNNGKAYSCGALIYMIGDVRVARNGSDTMFHGAQMQTNERLNIASVTELLRTLQEFNSIVYKIAEEETNQTEEEMRATWFDDRRENNFLSPSDLDRYDLLDLYFNEFHDILSAQGIEGLLEHRNSDQQDYEGHRTGLFRIMDRLLAWIN